MVGVLRLRRRLAGAMAGTIAVAAPAAAEPIWIGTDIFAEGSPSFVTSVPRHVWAQDFTIGSLAAAALTATNRRIDPEHGGSAKLGALYRWGAWDAGAGYRATFGQLNGDRSDLFVSPGIFPITFPVFPGVIDTSLSPFGFIPIAGVNASAEARSLLHAADIEIGHNLGYRWGELRLFGGARYIDYNSRLHSRFSNLGLAEFDVVRDGAYWGIGPRLGAAVTLPLSSRWRFSAGFSGSVLFGDRKTEETRRLSLPLAAISVADAERNGGGRAVFGFEGQASVSYLFDSGIYAAFGYGVQAYVGLNDTRRLDAFASLQAGLASGNVGARVFDGSSAGSIVNHGPFVRLGWRPGLSGPASRSGPLPPQNPLHGTLAVESRLFTQDAAHPFQRPHDLSLWGELDFALDFAEGSRVVVHPFLRYDAADHRRTHWDLREAYYTQQFGEFRVRFGVGRVFWGTTESSHLVDVINQTDLVETVSPIYKDNRLGQPMLQLSWAQPWGNLDVFYLPYARERTFPGRHGRLRSRVEIDTDETRFESGLGHWYPTFAARLSRTLGPLDLGIHYFHGTSRDPSFRVVLPLQNLAAGGLAGDPRIIPIYKIINQGAIDAQYTVGPWQLKFEGLVREGQENRTGREETYLAFVGGIEYSFRSFFGTGWDVGLLAEFLYDSRNRRATTPFEHDLFLGARVALNDVDDTRVLFGYFQDVRDSDKFVFVEASRRIGDRLRLGVEARFFLNPSADSILFDVRRDHHFQLTLAYKF